MNLSCFVVPAKAGTHTARLLEQEWSWRHNQHSDSGSYGSCFRMDDVRVSSRLRPRQIEDALGDDAEHHLTGAALDRIRLGAQPGARAGAAPTAGSLATASGAAFGGFIA